MAVATMIAMAGGLVRRLLLPVSAVLVVAAIALAVLAGTGYLGGVADAQSGLSPPANQQARNTDVSGVVLVSWDPAASADAYRVGWINDEEYEAYKRSIWLQRLVFAELPGSVSSYQVSNLPPGKAYWFIVVSVHTNRDGYRRHVWPENWTEKIVVTGDACPALSESGDGASVATATPVPTPASTPAPTRPVVCAPAFTPLLRSRPLPRPRCPLRL